MSQFIQFTVNGLTLGSVYALIALGYSMVYGILKLLNFAHGDVFMIGAFIGYGVLTVLHGDTNPIIPWYLMLLLMMLAAMLGTGLLGVAIERFAYRPLRNAPRIAPLISALGVSFFLEYSAQLLFGSTHRQFNAFSWTHTSGALFDPANGINWGNLKIGPIPIIVIVLPFVLMFALSYLVNRTRLGKAMRATSYDREAASMMGIDVDRVIVVTFLIGSALAGAAGVMYAVNLKDASNLMGFGAGLKAFTAAVIGGIGSIPGAMFGGLLLGFAEAYSLGYVSGRFSDLIVFAMLVVVLLVRPSGLLGAKDIKKV